MIIDHDGASEQGACIYSDGKKCDAVARYRRTCSARDTAGCGAGVASRDSLIPLREGAGSGVQGLLSDIAERRSSNQPCPATLLGRLSNLGRQRTDRARDQRLIYLMRSIGGGRQSPSTISFFGQYSRSTTLNESGGAGSQLDSLSAPGESFCR